MGAFINRLTFAADNLANIATNTSASRSRIEDTDYAQATTHGNAEPVVVLKQNRSKPLALIDLDYFIQLLRKATVNENREELVHI